MSGFHALFSVGGLAGAALISVLLRAGVGLVAVRSRHRRGAGGPRRVAAAAPRRRPRHRRQRLVHDRAEAGRAGARRAVLHVLSRRGRGARLERGVPAGSTGRSTCRIAGVGYAVFSVAMAVMRLTGDRDHPPRRPDPRCCGSAARSPPPAISPRRAIPSAAGALAGFVDRRHRRREHRPGAVHRRRPRAWRAAGHRPGDGHDHRLRRLAARSGADRLRRRRDQPAARVRARRGDVRGDRRQRGESACVTRVHVHVWLPAPAVLRERAQCRAKRVPTTLLRSAPSNPMMNFRRGIALLAACAAALVASTRERRRRPVEAAAAAASTEWPTYGHDPGGKRFSPLTQLTPANVGQLEVAWVYHMRPAPATPRAATAADAAGAGTRPRQRIRLRRQRDDADRHRRRDVHHLAVRPRRGARFVDRQGALGLPGAVRRAVDARRRVLGRRREDAAADRLRHGRRPAVSRSHAKTGEPNDAFGDKGIVNLNTPEILQGLPGNNGLSSPPTMYKHLIITGGRTQENPPLGPAGDVRAWDIHTGKLVWTFRSIPRAGREVQRHLGGRQLEEPNRRQRLGLHHRRRPARHRLHAVRRAVGRSVRRRSRGRQSLQLEPRRGRRQHRQVPLALPGRAPRHLGRRRRQPAGADRREAARPHDPGRGRRSARSGCSSCWIASPASRSTASRSGRCRRARCRSSAPRRRSRSRSSRRRSRA